MGGLWLCGWGVGCEWEMSLIVEVCIWLVLVSVSVGVLECVEVVRLLKVR